MESPYTTYYLNTGPVLTVDRGCLPLSDVNPLISGLRHFASRTVTPLGDCVIHEYDGRKDVPIANAALNYTLCD